MKAHQRGRRKRHRPEKKAAPASRSSLLLICLGLAGLTWIVFGRTLHHDFINYDDNTYVYDNDNITGGLTGPSILWAFTHAHAGNWHPLTSLSHMLDCQMYGLNPWGHHLTNVLLHTLAVVLLFLFLRQTTGALWRSSFVAAVFAIHPLRVESVAWVAERKDVLSGVFFMLTLLAYARYATGERSLRRYLLVAFCFALGLMAKPMLVTLPFILLLLDYWPLCRFGSDSLGNQMINVRRSTFASLVVEKVPFFLLSLVSSLLTWRAQRDFMRSATEIPLLLRTENAVVSCVRYLEQLIWPTDLAPFYPHPQGSLPVVSVIAAAALLVAISALVLYFGRKLRYLITGWGWYLVMLLPVIGLVQVGEQAMADRYTYLPHIGLVVAITWTVGGATAGARQWQRALACTATVLVMALVWCAGRQTGYWRNSESLWTHTLAVTSNNALAHNNLGEVWSRKGRDEDAIRELQAALEITPESPLARNNLGLVFLQEGKTQEALDQFRSILSREPENIQVRLNLAGALLKSGRTTEAIAEYQGAVAMKPDFAQGHLELGQALMRGGEFGEAVSELKIAVQLRPRDAQANKSLGTAFAANGQWAEAIRCWRETLEIDPGNIAARSGLAWALATNPDSTLRNGAEALAIAQALCQGPNASNPAVLRVLAAAYAETGRFTEAIETARHAIELGTAQNQSQLAATVQEELQRFESGQPLRGAGK
jgi:tetratricopeptide (TPR) repeat protein